MFDQQTATFKHEETKSLQLFIIILILLLLIELFSVFFKVLFLLNNIE